MMKWREIAVGLRSAATFAQLLAGLDNYWRHSMVVYAGGRGNVSLFQFPLARGNVAFVALARLHHIQVPDGVCPLRNEGKL